MAIGSLWHMCEYIILEDFRMDKYKYDESNGLWYELKGDYYFPCLTLPESENKPIGLWGAAAQALLAGVPKDRLHAAADQCQAERLSHRN